MSVMGLDPGGTTGISIITVPIDSITGDAPAEIARWEYGELYGPMPSQVAKLSEWVLKCAPSSGLIRPILAIEEFDLDPKQYHSRNRELLSPVRTIGAIEYANDCNHFGNVVIALQSRGLTKSTATDDRLKAWGLYTPGSEHVKDATRSAITMIRRLKGNPKLRKDTWGCT